MTILKTYIKIILFILIGLPLLIISSIIGTVYQFCTYGFTTGQFYTDTFMQRDWLDDFLPKDKK